MTPWRLLEDPPQGAAWNMAVDDALLACASDVGPPTLRLYAWSAPTLSLGYFQPVSDVDLTACRARGIEVVRRPTGGRAVLHDDELTYAVVAPLHRFPGGVSVVYHQISQALAEALAVLGIPTSMQRHHARARSAACFDTPAFAELCVAGKKVSGGAQTRTRHALLQHGSLPLSFPGDALAAALRLGPVALRALRRQAAGIGEFAPVDGPQLACALKGVFARRFGPLEPGGLSRREATLARALTTEKYAALDWPHLKGVPHVIGR